MVSRQACSCQTKPHKMLNNNDFAKLLTQPDQSGGKARYDLNQIKQWDKQNEAIKKKSFGSSSSSKHKSEDDEDGHAKGQKGEKESGGYKYVDRAEERRKQGGSLDPQQLEVIAASLDYEQSKFLGGDEEHTHLVKGLDYALLRKNREKGPLLASSSGQLSESVSSEKNMEMKRAPTKTMTALGQSIHKALFGANNTIPISTTLSDSGKAFNLASYASSSSSANTLNKGAVGLPNSTKKSVSMMIGHQGYDFDTDPTNANDLPTIVKRSKLEWEDRDELNYALPDRFLTRIREAMRLHTQNRLKRKKQESEHIQKSAISSVNTKVKSIVIDDIYSDIFEGIGKYEPVGALASSEIVSATETKEVAPVKNIFSDLFESNQTLNQSVIPGPKSSAKSATDGHRVGNLYSDLLSSNIDFVPSAPSIHLGRGKPTSIKSVIHRDIFLGGAVEENGSGTTNKKVRVAQGDLALAKRGDYQFEHDDDDGDGAFGSDQDNTDEGEKGKKTKKKKDTSRSDGIAGPNRAARRALANGNGSL